MPKLDLGKVVPQKGTDYFTEQDINDMVETTITELQPTLDEKADIEDIPDVSEFITKDVNDLTNYYKKTETYTKEEVDSKVSSVYKYKGSVATYDQLPSTGLTVGDVYNVEDTGDNYAWTGTTWDKLSGTVDLSGYQTKIDSTHKLNADLVDDTSSTNKFVTASDKTNWNAKEDASNKVTSISKNSTNDEYPSAKLLYDGFYPFNIIPKTSASSPFVFDGKKRGIYFVLNQGYGPFYIKFADNLSLQTSANKIIYFTIDSDFNYSEHAGESVKIGTVVYYSTIGASIYLGGLYKNSSDYIAFDGQIQQEFVGMTGNQLIQNKKTFVEYPEKYSTGYSNPTGQYQLTPKRYVDELQKNLAPIYDATSTYEVGDYVIYNGLLYVCNTAISTAEAWNSAHWTSTDIISNMSSGSATLPVINVDLYKSASTPLVLEDLEVGAYMLKSSSMTSSETFYLKARTTDTTTHSVGLSDFSHYFPFYKLNEFETGKNAYAFMSTSEMAFEIRKYDENSTSGIGSGGTQDIYKFFRTARNQYNSVASNNDYSGANNYTTLPTSSVAPTSNNQFANKKYVDDSIASAITTALGGSY